MIGAAAITATRPTAARGASPQEVATAATAAVRAAGGPPTACARLTASGAATAMIYQDASPEKVAAVAAAAAKVAGGLSADCAKAAEGAAAKAVMAQGASPEKVAKTAKTAVAAAKLAASGWPSHEGGDQVECTRGAAKSGCRA